MKIGDKIAKARKVQNLTQEQLADCLDVTRQAVSRWESDLAFPEMDKLVKLSQILQINCDYLLKDDVTESGEKILKVEVVKNNVGLFKKLNWSFIYSVCGMFVGFYIIALGSIFVFFNYNQFVTGNGLLIALTIMGYLMGLTIMVTSCVLFGKGIKSKEYFIKKQYKQ